MQKDRQVQQGTHKRDYYHGTPNPICVKTSEIRSRAGRHRKRANPNRKAKSIDSNNGSADALKKSK